MNPQLMASRFASLVSSSLCGVLALIGILLAPAADAKIHVRIAANAAATEAFNNWTAGTPWQEITQFKNGNASRPTVDMILELQALKAGGLDFDFELVRVLTYELGKTEVIQGRADLSAETIWNNEIAENAATVLKGPEIIRDGEFVKGIYVLSTNQKMLTVSSLDQLRDNVAAVVGTWALDAKTLEDMKLKGVLKKATPEIVFQMLQKHLADFTLVEFSASPDMVTEAAGVKLVPVPNCKIAIAGSRSWIVGKASPNAQEILKALETGAKILRENGTIQRAYEESGFFNSRVADWKRLF